jgi:hypothetical protein
MERQFHPDSASGKFYFFNFCHHIWKLKEI